MEHLIDLFDLIVAVYAGLTGLLVSSFLNVAVYRLPHGETIVQGHSHCMSCGHPLGALDLVPVFSYLLLGRRCRYCRAPISSRYMTVELAGGVFFTLAALASRPFLGPAPYLSLLLACTLFCLLLVDSLIRFDGHPRGLAGLYPVMLGLAALSAMPALPLRAQALPTLGLKAAGLALGLLALPAASRAMRLKAPLPPVPALPVAGLVLGLPVMLAVLLPVLGILIVTAVPIRARLAAPVHFGGAEALRPPRAYEPAASAFGRRLAPLAGFTLFALAYLLTA